MASHAAAGAAALAAGDYPAAITHYTTALNQLPSSPDYYTKRSMAFQRSSPPQYALALQDAEKAVSLAHKRAKRELIAAAQMRRGIALFGLGRYKSAGRCFEWARQSNEKETGLGIWEKKVETESKKLADLVEAKEDEDVTEVPEGDVMVKDIKPPPSAPVPPEKQASSPKPEGVQTPASKIRHEWYQTADTVVVTLFVKGVPKDQTTIEVQERSLSISFPMPAASTYDFSLEPLFAPIDSRASTHSIMSTKIELVLAKVTKGQKWPSLESKEPLPRDIDVTDQANPTTSGVPSNISTASAPSYPTSSRSGPKDWDKLAADLTAKPKKASTSSKGKGKATDAPSPPESPTEETYDSDEGDPVNGFFKKLYKDANPDTRRAMIKSYQESNGTALSTDWTEVGKKKVEVTPPEGMEAKPWDD
ncbi:MAG: hypothetical protein M1817_000481 [Caeruleum heppii]|nr:MAG: hypothetical protein M1817_000481 [Caeruleum heppii]